MATPKITPKLTHILLSVLTLSCLLSANTAVFGQHKDNKEEALATVNGRVITGKEADEVLGNQLQELQEKIYFIRKTAINNLIIKILLEEEAKARKTTVDDLKKQLISGKVEVSQNKVDEMYNENAALFTNMSQDEAKERIRLDLESHEKMAKYRAAIEELRRKAKVEIVLAAPPLKVANIEVKGPMKGSDNAPITIVEFSDFQCPYCKQVKPVLEQVLRHYQDKVKLVFMHLPLSSIHPQAFAAAQASVCADRQGKFWEFQDGLFDASPNLSPDTLEKIASDFRLNLREFNSCLKSEESRSTVLRDIQVAKKANVQGTPTFIINGQIMKEAANFENFKTIIEAELWKRMNK